MHVKKLLRRTTIITLFFLLIASCTEKEPPLTPLSTSEKEQLIALQSELKSARQRYNDYKTERERIDAIQDSYFQENVNLDSFSIFKTNQFDDGRDRACYKGNLINQGDEIIETLKLTITIYSETTKEKIEDLSVSIVDANDEFLDKLKDPKDLGLKAAILTLSGRELPLKPRETKDLAKGKRCFPIAFLDWKAEDATYEVTEFKLRTKLREVSPFDKWDLELKVSRLEERAKMFNQL